MRTRETTLGGGSSIPQQSQSMQPRADDTIRASSVIDDKQRSLASKITLMLLGLAVGDVALISACVVVAWQIRLHAGLGLQPSDPQLALASTTGPEIVALWVFLLFVRGAYSRRAFGAGNEEYRAVLTGSFATAGAIGLLCYLSHSQLSRGFVFFCFTLGIPALLLWRYLARQVVHRLRVRGQLVHRVLAVGASPDVKEVMSVLERERNLGFEVVGVCIPEVGSGNGTGLGVPRMRRVGEIRGACVALGADTVLVTRGAYRSSEELRRIAWDLQGSRIDLIVVPSLTEVAGPRIHIRPVPGLPLLHLEEPQGDRAGGLSKRLFDLVVGALVTVLVLPVMLGVALAIKLEDRGSVLFRQRRVGWNGTEFDCLKFRSMQPDASRDALALREADGHLGALWKRKDDARVTRVGRFIRRYSLDELPQILNVLKGSMSLVGPRPQQTWEVETYSESTHRRLLVRPGMTGLWQVSGRSDLPLEEAVRLDLYYVDNWSMTTDLVILTRTVKAVLSGGGAY